MPDFPEYFKRSILINRDRDSSVGIVTGYGLDGPCDEAAMKKRAEPVAEINLAT
jgi:hypothetical protein